MDFEGNSDRRTDSQAADGAWRVRAPEGMARWRWRLFAIMARFEADEGVYLRIASTRVTSCHGSIPEATDSVVRRVLHALTKKPRPV